ncbi:MAG: ClpXP protease specificity-enhancing factor SspB [Polyangiaceae bacterium]
MQALPPKKEVALALLQRSTVFIHLDPRREEVRVPPWFKKQPQLVLQIGLNMAVPIRDLEVDDEAISCTLSFNRTPHFCLMPWSAIYALVGEDGRGMVWPDDVPAEVAAQANAKGTQQQAPRKKPHLRAVGDDDADAGDADAGDADARDADEPETLRAEAGAAEAGAEGKPPTEDSTDGAPDEAAAADAPAAAEPKSARPALAALPSEPEAPPAEAAKDHAETASPDQEPAAEEKQDGKRKLPPYLRVVK